MRRTIAVPVRYKSLYISLPSFAKQQREMIKFCVYSLRKSPERERRWLSFGISIWS